MTPTQLQNKLTDKYGYEINGFRTGYDLIDWYSYCTGLSIYYVINTYENIFNSVKYRQTRIPSKYLGFETTSPQKLPFIIYALATNPILISYEHFWGKTADYPAFHILHEIGHLKNNTLDETIADTFALEEIIKFKELETEVIDDIR